MGIIGGGQHGRDKRRHQRGFRSFPLIYGMAKPEYRAMARRLSVGGLFIATNLVVYTPGTTLVMDLTIGGAVHRVTGIVRHSLKIDSRFVRITKPGMGIEFLDASEDLKRLLEASK